MSEFRLPDVGEGLAEAEVVTWHVTPGDVVQVNDVLVEIETAKSIVELPSPFAGVVGPLLVEVGQSVPVGTPLVRIVEDTTPDTTRHPVLVGYGPTTAPARRRRRRPRPPAASRPLTASRPLAKPPVRKLAKDLGVDLADVPHDGEAVSRAAVEAYASARAQAPAESTDAETRVPVRGVRKATAEAMTASAFTAPHVTEWLSVDVSHTVELAGRLAAEPELAGVKVTPTALVAKAACLALRRSPELNARWDEAEHEIVLSRAVHLGVAVATDRGLLVPVIRDASTMSLRELAVALVEVTTTAREGHVPSSSMGGGTFTITNVGVFGVDAGTPILSPGQSGILAVGAIARRPWVAADDTVVPRWVTTLAVSFDHRIVDGEQGARFVSDVAALLCDPGVALTY